MSGSWVYIYQLRDHLGSVRYTFKGDNTDVGFTHYYPFGMEYSDEGIRNMNSAERFTGHEFQAQHGLNVSDMGWRSYDASSGRTPTMDKRAEDYYWISPYVYCANNPVRFLDPDGRRIINVNYEKLNYSRRPTPTSLQHTHKTKAALDAILTTKDGFAFFSQFASAGDKVGSHTFTENGKYSNHILRIDEVSLSNEKTNLPPIGYNGKFSIVIDEETGLATVIVDIVSLSRDMADITQTLAHEIFLHGYDVTEIIDGKKKMVKDGGAKDHKALRDKDRSHGGYASYERARNILEQINQMFREAFERAEQKAIERYKDSLNEKK
ncbi:MAG: hypothetical protein LUG18_05605 [Candidatus Azobacteroides sp.]|nr:hypothetical protein [Candidatus Azobacteroides sp.]